MKLVANKTTQIDLTFTVEALPDYSSGDVVGGLVTVSNVVRSGLNSGKIVGAAIHNRVSHAVDLSLIFFNANPSGTTFTENSALTIAAADLSKVIADLALTRHRQFVGNSVALPAINQSPIPFELQPGSDNVENLNLYLVLLAGGILNQAATTDISGALFIEID